MEQGIRQAVNRSDYMYGNLPIENELKYLQSVPISMEYDGKEDFAQWQKRAKEKLYELLGMEKFTKCESLFEIEYKKEHKNFTEIRFKFQSEEGYFVPCILSVPKTDGKRPVMICLQGHGTGMHITMGRAKYLGDREKANNGDRNFAVQCISKGICALALDQRNFGEKGGNPKPVCHASSLAALLTGRTIIGGRVWDIMRAIDVLENELSEYCDSSRIYCMGNSGGGTATIYASALEDRIKAAIPSCAFCTFEDSIVRQNHCECNYIPNIRNYFDMAEIAGMIAPKPLVIVTGRTDGIFPVEPAKYEFERLKKYYKAVGKEENCAHVIGREGHRFYADEAWAEFDKLVEVK